MKKSRNLFWNRMFGGNVHINPKSGTDVHLFTISASHQVHIDVRMDEAVDAINVFNGIAGAQVALTANSNIWKGAIDGNYKCLGEMFWDWWLKDKHEKRYGVPKKKFHNLEDYFQSILRFSPVFVKRNGSPIGLPNCPTFLDFYSCCNEQRGCFGREKGLRTCGVSANGQEIEVTKEKKDLDQHFTFFWHCARLSRYYTLENRINDQQPPAELMTIPALSLGIMENLKQALFLVNKYPWDHLRKLRYKASCMGFEAQESGTQAYDISKEIVEIAEEGLKRRGLTEEVFLTPLKDRIEKGYCPADVAASIFKKWGVEGFVERFKIKNGAL